MVATPQGWSGQMGQADSPGESAPGMEQRLQGRFAQHLRSTYAQLREPPARPRRIFAFAIATLLGGGVWQPLRVEHLLQQAFGWLRKLELPPPSWLVATSWLKLVEYFKCNN